MKFFDIFSLAITVSECLSLVLSCTNLFLSFLSPSHLFATPHPRVTPCPNLSKQNRTGRSSLTDQNTLFSDFSPFTRGWPWGGIARAPRALQRTQHQPDRPGCAETQFQVERHRTVDRNNEGQQDTYITEEKQKWHQNVVVRFRQQAPVDEFTLTCYAIFKIASPKIRTTWIWKREMS